MTQISFAYDDKKDNLSTPKFRINKSIYSTERDENTLDTLKHNFNSLIHNDKSCNEEKSTEYQNNDTTNHFILSSLMNKTTIKNDLDNCYTNQFSFDEKSHNYIFSKNEDDNKDNINNNNSIIIINENENENEYNQDDNNEIKYINNIDNTLLTDSNKKYSNENTENNFNYLLPLESDKSSEHFNVISFQKYCEETEDNKNIDFKKIPNQKKMAGDPKYNNPEIINKKRGIGHFSKQKQKTSNEELKEELKLTPHKKNKNNELTPNNLISPKNNNNNSPKNKTRKTIFNSNSIDYSSKKKRNNKIRIPSLIEDYKDKECLTEPNIICIENKMWNTSPNNFFFSSNNDISNISKNENNIIISPFHIGKLKTDNNNTENEDITIIKKNNKNTRNSVKESSSSSFYKNIKINKIHSRNSSQSNNNNYTDEHSSVSKKIKNCITLVGRRGVKNSLFKTRNNSFNNNSIYNSISVSDISIQRPIIKIKEEKLTPFCKTKINELSRNKKALSKKFIFTQSSSLHNRKTEINKNNEKYKENNKDLNHNCTVFFNYDSKKNKKEKEKKNKDKIKNIETKKIKVNTINNNNVKNNKFHLNNTCYFFYRKNKPKVKTEKNKENLTERNRKSFIGPTNIYSKKLLMTSNNNSITNLYSTINNESINSHRKKNNVNKSFVINKEKKNLSITEYNNNKNNIIVKDKIKFEKYFNDILSKIDLNTNNKKLNISNTKKDNKSRNTHNLTNLNFYNQTEKNITFTKNNKKIKNYNKELKTTIKVKEYKTNNNSLNLGSNNKFNGNKISKKKTKITSDKGKSINVPNFKKNMIKYSILRNNENNQISSEISIYISKQKNNSQNHLNVYDSEYIKNKKAKFSFINNNNKLKPINVNKKTIINVNQFYPSYFINSNENFFKNKKNVTSYN